MLSTIPKWTEVVRGERCNVVLALETNLFQRTVKRPTHKTCKSFNFSLHALVDKLPLLVGENAVEDSRIYVALRTIDAQKAGLQMTILNLKFRAKSFLFV